MFQHFFFYFYFDSENVMIMQKLKSEKKTISKTPNNIKLKNEIIVLEKKKNKEKTFDTRMEIDDW